MAPLYSDNFEEVHRVVFTANWHETLDFLRPLKQKVFSSSGNQLLVSQKVVACESDCEGSQ
jgi:hypothetical protein